MITPSFRLVHAAATAICLSIVATADAQSRGPRQIRGQVVDASSGAPVEGAMVAPLPRRSGGGTASASNGRFAVTAVDARIVVARLGFSAETLAVAGDSDIIVRLRPAALSLSPTMVRADRATIASSSTTIRALDVALRPRESSQELLRLVPGLVIAQHAGGGKAEQLFLRGFDADHGTDVAISVDGTPVNLVTHAHGQGYADLHFVMPEVVEAIDVRKGPFDARDGDFATAGAVHFRTKDRIPNASFMARGGSFGARSAAALVPLGNKRSAAGGYLAGSAGRTDGPFLEPQGFSRANLYAKWTMPVGSGAQLVSSASHFAARWNASGQVPGRAVASGLIDRFGSIDSSEGGATRRSDLNLLLRSALGAPRQWELRGYATRYHFRLFSNFTFFAADSVNGDEIEQHDVRTIAGVTGSLGDVGRVGALPAAWNVGAGFRADAGDIVLRNAIDRRATGTRFSGSSRQGNAYIWAREQLSLTDRLRLELGVRFDELRFDVHDNTPMGDDARRDRSGAEWRGVVSPKGSLVFDATTGTSVFLSAGSGFHSNDARSIVGGSARDALPRATGAEVGTRHTWSFGTVALSAWGIDLASELVYVGDEGTTEASGRTRRTGLDVETRLRLAPRLWFDGDLTLARGRFRDAPSGESRIPLAASRTGTAGLTVRDAGPWTGGLRLRHVGSRPADERGEVRALGYTLTELFASRAVGNARLFVAVDNLFDVVWNEAQFATTSRLRAEPAPVTELHFTPGAPRSVQLGFELKW